MHSRASELEGYRRAVGGIDAAGHELEDTTRRVRFLVKGIEVKIVSTNHEFSDLKLTAPT
jgi:hypothetical protein